MIHHETIQRELVPNGSRFGGPRGILRRTLGAVALFGAVTAGMTAIGPVREAHATPCAADAAPENAKIMAELVSEARRARTWRYAWTLANAGSMALSLGALPILDESERPSLIVGAATAAVSGTFTWFWPLEVERSADQAMNLPCAPAPVYHRKLLRLREMSAADQADRLRWPWHVGNFVTALVPGAILWLGFGDARNGILTAAGGFAIGELELLTQPTGLVGTGPGSNQLGVAFVDQGLVAHWTLAF